MQKDNEEKAIRVKQLEARFKQAEAQWNQLQGDSRAVWQKLQQKEDDDFKQQEQRAREIQEAVQKEAERYELELEGMETRLNEVERENSDL